MVEVAEGCGAGLMLAEEAGVQCGATLDDNEAARL